MKRKLLILYGNYGAGHRQAARALAETNRLTRHYDETVCLNVMELLHPRTHEWGASLFVKGVYHFPEIYHYLFRKTQQKRKWLGAPAWLWIRESKLLEKIAEQRPAAIVSTFPLASAAVSALKKAGKIHAPLLTAMTDYTFHSMWLHDEVDGYGVPTAEIRELMLASGIPDHKIRVTGIPCAPQFQSNGHENVRDIKAKLGLNPDLKTILVMGGGCGLLPGEGWHCMAEDVLSDCQWVFLCGHNENNRIRFMQLFGERRNVYVHGYTDEVDRWMQASDILISKPGGLTVAESLCAGLPMLIYCPLPGQERGNAEYLLQAGAARMAVTPEALSVELKQMVHSPLIAKRLRRNIAEIRRPSAAQDILEASVSTFNGAFATTRQFL